MKQTVLVVDDNENIRKLVSKTLENSFNIIEALNGQEALEELSSKQVDLVILDLTMPVLGGIEVLQTLKAEGKISRLNIIVLSARNGTKERERAYKLGIKNYVEKPFSTSELLAIVNSFAKEKEVILKVANLSLKPDKFLAFCGEEPIDVTPQEYKVLEHFIKNKEILLTRENILEDVFKGREELSDRNVDTHISNLRKKIATSGVKIVTIYGQGYKLVSA